MKNFDLSIDCQKCESENVDFVSVDWELDLPVFLCNDCGFVGDISKFNYLIDEN